MATNLLSELRRLHSRLEGIEGRLRTLEARNRALEEENAELQRQQREAYAARDKALLDCEYLQVSHKLADSPDTLADTRRRIAGLIRNIDRCLDMLKE